MMQKKIITVIRKIQLPKAFQAIRIFVNQELSAIGILGLIVATTIIGERTASLIVISFHSLEDKIVKNFF